MTILNRLEAKPLEVLDISALEYLNGVGDECSFLMNWW